MIDLKTSNFHIEQISDLSEFTGEIYRFPEEQHPQNSVMLRITPMDKPSWTGLFDVGIFGLSGIWEMPNPQQFCIIQNGNGYIVDACSPSNTQQIPIKCIDFASHIIAAKLFLTASYYSACAYDEAGIRWHPEFVVSDDLKIVDVNDTEIVCNGSIDGRSVELILDLKTGKVLNETFK